MFDYPNLSPEAGDTLTATRYESWGHVAERHKHIGYHEDIDILFGDHLELPHGEDTFNAIVNGEQTDLHIDVVTEIFQLADEVTFER